MLELPRQEISHKATEIYYGTNVVAEDMNKNGADSKATAKAWIPVDPHPEHCAYT
jgi:hypothetical protein